MTPDASENEGSREESACGTITVEEETEPTPSEGVPAWLVLAVFAVLVLVVIGGLVVISLL